MYKMNIFHLKFWFGRADSRPISVFRVFFSALLLKNAVYNLSLADEFFSDAGYVPRSALWDGLARADRFSLMDAMPYSWMATAFFILWAGVALCLLIGHRTRLMVVLNFVIVLSIHERNVYVLNGADTVLRVLSFWMLFLPLDRFYSIDAMRTRCAAYTRSRDIDDLRGREEYSNTVFAFPLRAIQIQIAIIYLFSFIEKLPGDIWQTGDGIHYALQMTSLTLPTGDWFLSVSPLWLTRLLSYFTLFVEAAFPLLIFAPFWQPVLRLLGLGLGMLLHLGIAVTMSIPNFSLIMLISYLLFCDSSWLLAVGRKLVTSQGRSSLMLPPTDSPLWMVLAATSKRDILIDQSKYSQANGHSTWEILSEQGESFRGPSAWGRLVTHFPLGYFIAWIFRYKLFCRLVWSLMGWCVRRISLPKSEHGTGVSTERVLMESTWVVHIKRAFVSTIIGVLMVGIVWYNLPYLVNQDDRETVTPVPVSIAKIIRFSGLWQRWNLFAPYPRLVDGWIVAPGRFEDGVVIDLRSGEAVSDKMMRWFWGPDGRWKKYESNLYRHDYHQLKFAWARRYCREYNTRQERPEGKRLATLELQFRYRRSHAPDSPPNSYQTRLLWKHWCYPEYKY